MPLLHQHPLACFFFFSFDVVIYRVKYDTQLCENGDLVWSLLYFEALNSLDSQLTE